MSAERILYPPCYFDATLERREGRRVAKNFGVKSPPELPAIEAVLRKMKVPHRWRSTITPPPGGRSTKAGSWWNGREARKT